MRVAVVGATGAVGTIMLRCSSAAASRRPRSSRSPPSARPASELGDAIVQPLSDDTIEGFDVALFCAGGGTSREWAPRFAAAGALVVDNSSAWRMDPDVPLVVSEVNPDALDHIGKGIVANPNCTTMAVMLPAKALHDAFGLRAMVCTCFQAAGGAGQKGMDELAGQVDRGRAPATSSTTAPPRPRPCSRRSTPRRWPSTSCPGSAREAGGGYTDEEMKLQNESRKILDLPDLAVAPTCVRVPVWSATRSRCARPSSGRSASTRRVEALGPSRTSCSTSCRRRWSGPAATRSPSAACAPTCSDDHALNFFVVGDNLLKGAALNTVQIAELLHERGLVGAGARV